MMISPGNSDQLLGRATREGERNSRGPGAGRPRSAARVRAEERAGAEPFAAEARTPPDPPARLPVPPRPVTTEAGRLEASAGVPTAGGWFPVGEGMFSQYWLLALTVACEQAAPGWSAAAGTACASAAAQAHNRHSSELLGPLTTESRPC